MHCSDFDFKVVHLQLAHRQTIAALDEDELRATDTPHALHGIIRFVLSANCQDLISSKERTRRSCISQHIRQVDLWAIVQQRDRNIVQTGGFLLREGREE